MPQHKLENRDGQEETQEERRRKKRANQLLFDELKAADEGVVPAADLLVEPSVDRHAALLRDAQFSGTANAEQIAQIVTELEQHYGNAYVQQVMAQLRLEQAILDSTACAAMKKAWEDSDAGSYDNRHEEGGWIIKTGAGYEVARWPSGTRNGITPSARPGGKNVVAAFHTHPNPDTDENGDSWDPAPSGADIDATKALNFSEDGYVVGIDNIYKIEPDGTTGWVGARAILLG